MQQPLQPTLLSVSDAERKFGKLSKYFDWYEVSTSSSRPDLAAAQLLTYEECRSAYLLARLALDPIRLRFGETIVDSWFRSNTLNQAVKGVGSSQHQNGEAVDIICRHAKMSDVYNWACFNLAPCEIIHYLKRGHVHIGLPRPGVRADHLILDK